MASSDAGAVKRVTGLQRIDGVDSAYATALTALGVADTLLHEATPHSGEIMTTGIVIFFNAAGGFGFIRPDDGSKDVFMHVTAVERSGLGNVNERQRLSYDLDRGSDGEPFAFNLKAV